MHSLHDTAFVSSSMVPAIFSSMASFFSNRSNRFSITSLPYSSARCSFLLLAPQMAASLSLLITWPVEVT